jgi:release factor glutamine methyltransferase
MRKLAKLILFPFLKKIYTFRMKRPREFSSYGIDLIILPSVFHPGVFLSTSIFIEFLKALEMENKKVLELGAGSGMISFYSAKYKKAIVTASDINPNAIEGLKKNSELSKIPITVVASDLFAYVHPADFDFILINPPYYAKDPENLSENAFYCGANFEYFIRLFDELSQKANLTQNQTYLILSQDCEIHKIKQLAKEREIAFQKVYEIKKIGEWNYIFRLVDA